MLRSRGLYVRDEHAAIDYLRIENYYRFSGYAREYQLSPRQGDDTFKPGTGFDDIVAAMRADERLAQLLLQPLLRVERAIRGHLAYELAMVHGERAFYLDPAAYIANVGKGCEITEGIESRLIKSKHRGVRRYVNGTDCSAVPIWVAVEDMSFGTLAQLITHLDDRTAIDAVAENLGIKRVQFPSVVGAFAYLRNSCAHHAQLWHRYGTVRAPLVIKNSHKRYHPTWTDNSSYPTVIALGEVLRKVVDPTDAATTSLSTVTALLQSGDEHARGFLSPQPR